MMTALEEQALYVQNKKSGISSNTEQPVTLSGKLDISSKIAQLYKQHQLGGHWAPPIIIARNLTKRYNPNKAEGVKKIITNVNRWLPEKYHINIAIPDEWRTFQNCR